MSRSVMVLSLAVFLAVVAVEPSPAQAPAPDRFSEQSFVTAIDLVVEALDADGRTPADLQPADFRILENGIERRIIGVEYLDPTAAPAAAGAPANQAPPARPHWQIVIWIDAVTTSGPTLTLTTRELIKRVPDLLRFGPVTLVYSDISPEILVDSTRDEKVLAEAIGALKKRTPGNRIMRIRREFLSALDAVRELKTQRPEGMALGAEHVIIEPVDEDIPGYVAEEERLLAMSRRNLLSSLERLPRRLPRMLLYVGDGFDLIPGEFYVRNLDASGAALVDIGQLRAELSTRANQDTDEMMRRLAIGGWTAVVVGGASNVADDVTRSAGRRLHDNRVGTGPALVFLNSEDPLKTMAEETGGERVGLAPRLQQALRDVGRRVRITYQVDREPDPAPRRVEIVANRPGLSVRAPKWASSTTQEGLAESRAIESLRKEGGVSDLPVTARLLPPSDGSLLPTLEVRADFSTARNSFANIGATKLRFTIAIETSGRPAPIVHQIATVENLAGLRGFVWKSPMKMPENVSAIAVVAEELLTGLWGATRFTPGEPQGTEPPAAARLAASTPPEPLAPRDADEAFARAAAEKKLVVAFETNDAWEGCELDCRLLENRATSHPEIQRLLGSFVAVETPQTALPPRIAIYDPSRRLLLSWSAAFSSVADRRRPFSTGELAEILKRATEASPHALRAHELFSAGQAREEQMALGTAFRAARQADRAEAAWTEAARLAAAAGDRAAQQTAEVLSANMAATQGRAAEALIRLRAIAAAPASPANEAEALLVIAQIQRTAGDEKSATAALSRALAVAPAGSETYRLAARLSAAEPGTRHVAPADASATRPLQLLVSGRAPFSGRTRLQVIVRDPAVSSVTFTPGDGRTISDSSPPFEATIDLGPIPRTFEVRAVARDSAGRSVGEDVLTLNERHDEFWIRVRRDSAAEVRAEMSIPEGGRVATLTFFADGKPLDAVEGNALAARFSPKAEPSVIRAVATLADGRTAEDAILVGETGYAENIEARDVEIYATVLDRNGDPIRSLDRSQFALAENGAGKRIRSFETLERAPFSIGLAVDSSSSMNDVMPDVHRTARTFLSRAVADGSSAFLIDFDEAPRLAAARTTDIAALNAAIGAIRADGSTALYDSIIFGLLQLQGIHGKRALIVLTDGRDESSRYSLEDAVAVARESAVAIYAIILAPRQRPEDAKLDPPVEKIAVETGGRAWYLPESANMDAIYRAIDLELRNQYRLTYRTTPGKGSSDWRPVKVTVDVPGATVRTAAGFVAR